MMEDVRADAAEELASQGPYLYQPSESRSARVINRAGSPARSESSAFSRQAEQLKLHSLPPCDEHAQPKVFA